MLTNYLSPLSRQCLKKENFQASDDDLCMHDVANCPQGFSVSVWERCVGGEII